jgi:hypothetical protein
MNQTDDAKQRYLVQVETKFSFVQAPNQALQAIIGTVLFFRLIGIITYVRVGDNCFFPQFIFIS